MVILNLLTSAFSTIFYGIASTAVIMLLLYALLQMLNPGIVKSLTFYATGVVLACLLSVQFSLLIGAVKAMGMVDSVEMSITQMADNSNEALEAIDSQHLLDSLIEQYPLLGVYIGGSDILGNAATTIVSAITYTMRDFLASYIWHRVWWILGFIIVACTIAILFRKKETLYTIDMDKDLGIY